MFPPERRQPRHALGVFALGFFVAACSDEDPGSGGGGASSGGSDAFPRVCPGFESEPGAGCPAPCEPLVSGGPGGRAYCTTPCSEDCPLGHHCGYSEGPDATDRDVPDVCLPGSCDSFVVTSCPDDMSCREFGFSYCYPSPGTVGTRCEVYVPVEGEACSEECPYRLELETGALCTMECIAQAHPCAAGYVCLDDVLEDFPGLCTPPCAVDSDCPLGLRCTTSACPGPPCPKRGECDFLYSF
jgi:hypothetical protein